MKSQPSFLSQVVNIASFSRSRARLKTLAQKIRSHFFDPEWTLPKEKYFEWLVENQSDFSDVGNRLNPTLWEESVKFHDAMQVHATQILSPLEHHLGGGAYCAMLYFLTRHLKPAVVVETGVASGYSSRSFLTAMKENSYGHLYSSDFPYFRLKDPEQYIGILVEDELKSRWSLYIEGDSQNLRIILNQVSQIDLFHYDSDKSFSGRRRTFLLIEPKLGEKSIVIFDDTQGNSFFYDLVRTNPIPRDKWHVFKFRGKYLGVLGSFS
jgi:predicted O-methyltransferase YrrM